MPATFVVIGPTEYEVTVNGDGTFSVGQADVLLDVCETADGEFTVLSGGRSWRIVAARDRDLLLLLVNGREIRARVESNRDRLLKKFGTNDALAAGIREVRAPMPALVVDIEVEIGQEVRSGQGLIILEAMKMENEIRAQQDGRISEICVKKGMTVEKGELMIRFGKTTDESEKG